VRFISSEVPLAVEEKYVLSLQPFNVFSCNFQELCLILMCNWAIVKRKKRDILFEYFGSFKRDGVYLESD
jgi:hypothetical protein